jgi:hypothetical protein
MKKLFLFLAAIALFSCDPAMESSLESSNTSDKDSSIIDAPLVMDNIPVVTEIYPNPCQEIWGNGQKSWSNACNKLNFIALHQMKGYE